MAEYHSRADWLALAAWGAAILAGFSYAGAYGSRAGQPSENHGWPVETALQRGSDATIVMFVEPDCPCSTASLHELNLIMADARTHARAVVVFEPTPGTHKVDAQSNLLHRASEMRVQIYKDTDGAERKRFDAHTSGTTLVYGSDGQLRFSGGVTASRGHEGDNPGSRAVAAWVRQAEPSEYAALVHGTPVYGCHFDAEEN